MDKLTFIGRLTRDPELRVTTTGTPMCTFDVAVNNPAAKAHAADGQQPPAKYYRVTAWQKQAEACNKYLTKGQQVYVEGDVTASAYISKQDGQPRASLNVSARQVEFLGGKGDSGAGNAAAAPQTKAPYPDWDDIVQVPMDELPF